MTLHMSPMDDTFVSGSLDRTLRLWDLRSPNCQVQTYICLLNKDIELHTCIRTLFISSFAIMPWTFLYEKP